MAGGPEDIDINKPETWVKEDPNNPGESIAVAILASADDEKDEA